MIKNDEKTKYILRLELKDKKIYLFVSLEDKIEYNYKTFMDLSTIVNKLELNFSRQTRVSHHRNYMYFKYTGDKLYCCTLS